MVSVIIHYLNICNIYVVIEGRKTRSVKIFAIPRNCLQRQRSNGVICRCIIAARYYDSTAFLGNRNLTTLSVLREATTLYYV